MLEVALILRSTTGTLGMPVGATNDSRAVEETKKALLFKVTSEAAASKDDPVMRSACIAELVRLRTIFEADEITRKGSENR